jgi:hypothetical protein
MDESLLGEVGVVERLGAPGVGMAAQGGDQQGEQAAAADGGVGALCD